MATPFSSNQNFGKRFDKILDPADVKKQQHKQTANIKSNAYYQDPGNYIEVKDIFLIQQSAEKDEKYHDDVHYSN